MLAVPATAALPAPFVAPAAAAAVDEVHVRPADGVFALSGRGWGHGRGMSQWGAQGAASHGVSADTITATYYPGTAKGVLRDAPVRVLLSGDEGRDTQVVPAAGLTVTDLATGVALRLPAGPRLWRATPSAAGLQLSGLTGSTWVPYRVGGAAAVAGPLRFAGPALVRVRFPDGSARDYRSSVRAVRTSATTLGTVAVMGLEHYLLGVVPREAPSSWLPAALQAQSIAARSYSAYKRARPRTSWYDLCDTTACQVFGGSRVVSRSGVVTPLEPASTTAAVRATRGVVRTFRGAPILAEFSSSNGGWSTAGGVPYLVARPDPWDGVLRPGAHAWTARLPVAALERAYPAVGRLTALRVTSRDGNGPWGGRIEGVVLEGRNPSGAATRVVTTGQAVRNAHPWPTPSDALRSRWFSIRTSYDSRTVARSTGPVLAPASGRSAGVLAVRLRNTGATAWPLASLHLSPVPGSALALAGGSTARAVSRPGAATVAPGEDVELRVELDAAAALPGRYAVAYRLQIGSGPQFGALVPWTVSVTA